jgi:NAD(P)-dependent dehydrogenase (short-subunit alcohol dehydrogenase family)
MFYVRAMRNSGHNTRTAVITGGSRGFGRALTTGLTGQGWLVVIDGRDAGALKAVAESTGAVAVPGDVTDAAHRVELVGAARSRSGRLDLLVNNAGGLGPSPLPSVAGYPLDELESLFRVNVTAPLGLVQLALPLLRESAGAVVNVTSDAAVEAYPGWSGYGSTKAALEQASRVLSAEEDSVRVWWFDPGDMRTAMHQEAFPGEDISDRPEPETVVPAVLRLVDLRPPSGRVRASDLLAGAPR